MGVVHHYQGIVAVRQVADPFQIGNDAVHGKNPIGGNDTKAAVGSRLELLLQVGHIVILVTQAFGLTKSNPVDDAGMV